MSRTTSSRALGDLQTPRELVRSILDTVWDTWGPFERVLEPTCGRGHFLAGALEHQPPVRELHGIEIQSAYAAEAATLTGSTAATVHIDCADVFETDFAKLDWGTDGPLLVVGNPPWVTNAELGALDSTNRPARRNVERIRGIEAMTGASNFDLAEAVWLKLLTELVRGPATIALLSKRSVARRVLRNAQKRGLAPPRATIYSIDAGRWFGASTAACLMVATTARGESSVRVTHYDALDAAAPTRQSALINGNWVADLDAYQALERLDGDWDEPAWRQGVKHDAARVMELRKGTRGWTNGLGEPVCIEDSAVYPLLKSTDLHRGRLDTDRGVVVTQPRPGAPTDGLAQSSPLLWRYLNRHRGALDRRRSAVYARQPAFAMFGIGPYSFAPFKVAVSGLHLPPRFRALGPRAGRPVLVDDTAYQLACESATEAALLAALLNSDPCQRLLTALTFSDAKRPVTKRLLSRIDRGELVRTVDWGQTVAAAEMMLESLTPGAVPVDWRTVAATATESTRHEEMRP